MTKGGGALPWGISWRLKESQTTALAWGEAELQVPATLPRHAGQAG
jgi:hypothetical protein